MAACQLNEKRKLNIFEKYLTVWVLLCIGSGIIIGKIASRSGEIS